jgi:hypothetical protein
VFPVGPGVAGAGAAGAVVVVPLPCSIPVFAAPPSVAGAEVAGAGVVPVAGAGAGCCFAAAAAAAAADTLFATDDLNPTNDNPSDVRKNNPAQIVVTFDRNVTAPRPPNAEVAAPPPSAAPMPASFPGWRRITNTMKMQSRMWRMVKKVSMSPGFLHSTRPHRKALPFSP